MGSMSTPTARDQDRLMPVAKNTFDSIVQNPYNNVRLRRLVMRSVAISYEGDPKEGIPGRARRLSNRPRDKTHMCKTVCQVWVVALASSLTFHGGAWGRTIYVDTDANGAQDGTNWANAFNHLQDGLAAAAAGNEIWVAEGIYKPDTNSARPHGTGDRGATFQLKTGVTVTGGYAGFGKLDPNARDTRLHTTVLSGDLLADDGPGFHNNSENSYHVVSGSGVKATAVLDGFRIIGGNADHGDIDGAGMYNLSGSPTVIDCTFVGNSARWYGGGMFNNMFSSPTLINCTFVDNDAKYGGGMENRFYSEPTLTNCLFSGNTAEFGAGLSSAGASPTCINCTITQNWAARRAGGMYNRFDSKPEITNCIVWGNRAEEGAQITMWYDSELSVTCSDIEGGQAGLLVVESTVNWGEGNIDLDPCFVETGFWDSNGIWIDGDYHLLPASPCIDAASNIAIPSDKYDIDRDGNTAETLPWDAEGEARIDDGDNDGNSVVDMGAYEFFVPPLEVWMKLTPQRLNPDSKGNWMKAHLVLPNGFTVDDIDANTPCRTTEPFDPDIESSYVNVFINDDGFVEVETAFERAAFCQAGIGTEPTEVRVEGRLVSGRPFCATHTLRVTDNTFKYLAVMGTYWLDTTCANPEWCAGTDKNQDCVVNFADFALLDGCCIEVLRE